MVATDHGEVVGKFGTAQDRKAGYEDLVSQICKARDIQSYLAEHIRNHVKAVIIPLRAGFVQGVRTELVKPGTLERVVILVDGTAPRKASQRLQVWILLQVVRIAVAENSLLPVAELVIEAAGPLTLAHPVAREPAVSSR